MNPWKAEPWIVRWRRIGDVVSAIVAVPISPVAAVFCHVVVPDPVEPFEEWPTRARRAAVLTIAAFYARSAVQQPEGDPE
jgi:hypothetical protein